MAYIIQKSQFDIYMPSITKEVWRIIESDRAIEKDLARNIINMRALARFIIDKYGLGASLDSVISAIRRFDIKSTQESDKKLSNLFKEAIIKTRNNIVCITVRHETGVEIKAEGIRKATGSESSKLIIEKSRLKEFLTAIPRKAIEKIEENLSELSINIDERAIKTRGVLARIANEISMSNINIEEIIISPPEFLIYVKEENITRTYESVLRLQEKSY
jgi:predicted regulator of amino acid metabolism with ACT domain